MSAFHLTKTFENVDSAANGTEMSPKSVQKFLKLLNFEMRTIQPQNLEILWAKLNGKKTSGEKNSKIWVYLARLSSFSEILELLFHSLLEVADNSNRTFWLNGKRPIFTHSSCQAGI